MRRLSAVSTFTDKIESRVGSATARVEKIIQSILAKAFRGELMPTEAELARQEGRDYEPASILLQRIRAKRNARMKNLPHDARAGARSSPMQRARHLSA